GLRREIRTGGIGAAHDQRETIQRWFVLQTEQPEQGVEAAARPLVRNFNAFDVEGDGASFLRARHNLIGIDIKDTGLRIDETADQPWTRHAVDLRPPPRNP